MPAADTHQRKVQAILDFGAHEWGTGLTMYRAGSWSDKTARAQHALSSSSNVQTSIELDYVESSKPMSRSTASPVSAVSDSSGS